MKIAILFTLALLAVSATSAVETVPIVPGAAWAERVCAKCTPDEAVLVRRLCSRIYS